MNETVNLMHFDFHNPVGIENLAKNFDEKRFAKALKAACVTHINFFAECNNGYCYFPTKVGVTYPTLKKDLFGKVLFECHKQDVKVNAYVHLGLNHVQALKHFDWAKDQNVGSERYVEEKDKPKGIRFTNFMCYNSDGYKNYVLALVKEILNYDIDGLFFDGFYPEECYCPTCNALMYNEKVDTGSPIAVIEFQKRKMVDFANSIKKIIPQNMPVIFNGFPPEYKLNTRFEYEGNFSNVYKSAYLRNLYPEGAFMTGRFCKGWGDYGGIKPQAEFESDLYDSLMGCYDLAFGDHLHPVDGVNYEMLSIIGKVFQQRNAFAEYVKNQRPVAEIGVLCDGFKSLDEPAYSGVTTLLDELHFTYDVINLGSDFKNYSLIILPDEITLTADLKNKLDDAFENGCKILSSGISGFYENEERTALKCHDGIKEVIKDYCTTSYFKFEKPFGEYKDTAFSTYFPAVKIKCKGEKLAAYVEPLFESNNQKISGVFYNAQGNESKYSVAFINDGFAHISFNIFKAYAKFGNISHKELFKRTIESLMETPLIKTNLPSFTKTAVTKSDKCVLLHVKSTHPSSKNGLAVIERHTVLPEGFVINVKGRYETTVILPKEKKIKTKYKNGYTKIILPEIDGYLMIQLIKGE